MKNILIVVDMQNDFVDGSLGSDEAVSILNNAVEKIANFDGKIFATLDTHDENYLNTLEGQNLPVEHCIKGTYGWKLNKQIFNALSNKDYILVEKPTFGSMDLINHISNILDIETDISIELIGLCTDICVISNALLLKANFYETPIYVDASACAGTTHKSHQDALNSMKSCQINIINE